jgi:hypothetical protein
MNNRKFFHGQQQQDPYLRTSLSEMIFVVKPDVMTFNIYSNVDWSISTSQAAIECDPETGSRNATINVSILEAFVSPGQITITFEGGEVYVDVIYQP